MAASLGLIIYAAVKPIFKIYIIIGIGFYLARRNILTVTTCRDISDAIVTIIMPCLIFDKIVTNIVSSDIKNIGIIFFEGTLLYGVGILFALAIYYLCKSPKAWFGGLLSVGLFPNISDLPIAYLQTLSNSGGLFTEEEGAKGVAYVCIFLASQVFYQFSMGLFRLIEYDFRDQLVENTDTEAHSATESHAQLESNLGTNLGTNLDNHLEKLAHLGSQPHSQTDAGNEHTDEILPTDVPDNASAQQSQITALLSDSISVESKLGENVAKPDHEPASEVRQHDEFLMLHGIDPVTSNPRSSVSISSLYGSSTNNYARRRNTLASANTNYYSLNPVTSRTVDLRHMKSQDIQDVINEYSEFDRLKSNEVRQARSITSEVTVEETGGEEEIEDNETMSRKIMRRFLSTISNFKTPNSLSLIISIIIAMAPPLKALFVKTSFYMPTAPDKQPPLSFVIDFTAYVGAASVPLGLLLLGATIARLKVQSIVPGFWKTVVAISACRLILMPVFGVGLTTGIYKAGWFGDDKLIRFVSVLEYGLPNATALVYFTAFYTDPTSPDHLQMDCLALCLIAQYSILFITLPFLVTFTLKVSLGF